MNAVSYKDFYDYEAHVYVSACGDYLMYIHPYGQCSMEYEHLHEIRFRKRKYDKRYKKGFYEVAHNDFGPSYHLWRHNTDEEGDGPESALWSVGDDIWYINGKELTYNEWLNQSCLSDERKVELKLLGRLNDE